MREEAPKQVALSVHAVLFMRSKAFFRYVICGAAIQTATFLIASLGQKLDFGHRRSSSSREVVCTSGCKVELQGPIFSSVLWQMKVWSSSEVCEHSCHNVVLIYLLMWRDAFTVESGKCGSDMKMLFIHFCHAYCNKRKVAMKIIYSDTTPSIEMSGWLKGC